MKDFSTRVLKNSYQEKFKSSLSKNSLTQSDILSSLAFFEDNNTDIIVPKKLHTYCIVAGVPFDKDTTKFIENCCLEINNILSDTRVYFVKPENFGLELLMLKWPEDSLPNEKSILSAKNYLNTLSNEDIEISIKGFQFHTDGCILLKGYDKNGAFRRIRERGLKLIPDIPIRQSSWCHIPLGRIISEVKESTYMQLVDLMVSSSNSWNHTFKVKHLKLLEETRWYQEENKLLFQINFN